MNTGDDPQQTQPQQGERKWTLMSPTQADEDAFNYEILRDPETSMGVIPSIANMVKGALGAGILGGHAAFMKGGLIPSIIFTCVMGCYICYCLNLLVASAQILYKRTHSTYLTYSDVGEAAFMIHPNPKVSKHSRTVRRVMDSILAIDLFGCCCCYQIIISKCIKQLVENVHTTSVDGIPGYPGLRVYLAIMIVPLSIICLIRHLKWIAPFSIAANCGIVICVGMAIYYAFHFNPGFQGMKRFGTPGQIFEMVGVSIFSMSATGITMPTENAMREPTKFKYVIGIAYIFIFLAVFCISFFGYVAFLNKCETPITINFPSSLGVVFIKLFIPFMVFITHALVFWVPFNVVFTHIRKRHSQKHIVLWEYFYRIVFVVICGIVAIIFPNVVAFMGFLGAFCLSNMAFIWPSSINICILSHRPGFGKYRWKLWKGVVIICIGLVLLVCGSFVTFEKMLLTNS